MPNPDSSDVTNPNFELIENLHSNIKQSFSNLPQEFIALFHGIEATDAQKLQIVDVILNDSQLLNDIATGNIPNFIEHCFRYNCFTLQQKKMAYYQLRMGTPTPKEPFHAEVSPTNIVGRKRKKTSEQSSYARFFKNDDSDSESEDANYTVQVKKNKTEKKLTSEKQSENLFLQLKKYFSQIKIACQDFQKEHKVQASATSSLRNVKNGYFTMRLVLGPFGDSLEEASNNGKTLLAFLKAKLHKTSYQNIFLVDAEGQWKINNKRDGYTQSKKVVGSVVKNDDPIGSVIITGCTSLKCVKLFLDLIDKMQHQDEELDHAVHILTNIETIERNRDESLDVSSQSMSTTPSLSNEDTSFMSSESDLSDSRFMHLYQLKKLGFYKRYSAGEFGKEESLYFLSPSPQPMTFFPNPNLNGVKLHPELEYLEEYDKAVQQMSRGSN